MISVIISSRDERQLSRVSKNIQDTIGVAHEILFQDNSEGLMGICEVYNSRAALAGYPILCFVHEDVHFETQDWGVRLCEHLSKPDIGLVGLAGGDTKSYTPSSWSSFISPSEVNIVQHFKGSSKEPLRIHRTGSPDSHSALRRVACLDGVLLATRKDVFEKFQFDALNFKGFHAYDIDFSLQVGTAYEVCVMFDVVLHHFSAGSFNRDWLESAKKIGLKWRRHLPVSVRNLSADEFCRQHWTAMRVYIYHMIALDLPVWQIVANYLKFSFTPYFHGRHFLHFLKLIIQVKILRDKKAMLQLEAD